MKMRGTNRQDQHCSRRRFAGCGTSGIGWIIWGLGKIFLTPRPMRIGLSGLILWVGMAGVTLAAPASDNTQSTASSPSTRPIRNPFNVQGYMLEMAAKMNQAGVRDAVVGETGIQRSALTNGTASSRGTWQPTTPPATIQPDITRPATSKAKWLTSGDSVTSSQISSQPSTSLPLWSSIRDESKTGSKKTDSENGHVRWLTPGASATNNAAGANSTSNQVNWRPAGSQAAPTTSGTASNQVTWLTPSSDGNTQMGGQSNRNQTSAAPTMSGSAMRQTNWLTSTPTAAPRATTSTTNSVDRRSSRREESLTSGIKESRLRQVKWLTAKTPIAPRAIAPAPTTNQVPWPQSVTETTAPAPVVSSQPATYQAAPTMPTTSQPAVTAPATDQITWQQPTTEATAPAPTVSQPTTTTPQSTITQSPLRQANWLTPKPQTAAVPEVVPSTATRQLNQESWLAPENRAAQRALDKIRVRQTGVSETPAADPTVATGNQNLTAAAATRPQTLQPSSSDQALLLSSGAVNPQMALMAINPTAYAGTDMSQAKHFYEKEKTPWSLGADLDKYREHALQQGSRDFGVSLVKALENIGLAVEDTTNIITLGYASDRAKQFRANDGKGLFEEPGRVPQQMGATLGSFGDGLYSVIDLVTLNAMPDQEKSVYRDNHVIVRPLIFTGRTIGGVWKTTEELGNALTWGYFDNVTGSIGMCLESLIEMLKHTGEAVTNLARVPVHLMGGKDSEADKALDWVLLVPLEFASNVVEMKGISNMEDYETAFADKGVIGSILEFGGSTFLVYRAVDEMIDEWKDDDHGHHKNKQDDVTEPETPIETPETPTETPSTGGTTWTDYMFGDDGVISGTRTE